MPGESCRRWTSGREADWQRRGAHLEACGADSLLVLRHSQRPDGDARRRLLLCPPQKFWRWGGGRQVKLRKRAYDDNAYLCTFN